MTTNAQRQAAYKERMRKAGLQQVTVWIPPELKDTIRKIAKFLTDGKKDPTKCRANAHEEDSKS